MAGARVAQRLDCRCEAGGQPRAAREDADPGIVAGRRVRERGAVELRPHRELVVLLVDVARPSAASHEGPILGFRAEGPRRRSARQARGRRVARGRRRACPESSRSCSRSPACWTRRPSRSSARRRRAAPRVPPGAVALRRRGQPRSRSRPASAATSTILVRRASGASAGRSTVGIADRPEGRMRAFRGCPRSRVTGVPARSRLVRTCAASCVTSSGSGVASPQASERVRASSDGEGSSARRVASWSRTLRRCRSSGEVRRRLHLEQQALEREQAPATVAGEREPRPQPRCDEGCSGQPEDRGDADQQAAQQRRRPWESRVEWRCGVHDAEAGGRVERQPRDDVDQFPGDLDARASASRPGRSP